MERWIFQSMWVLTNSLSLFKLWTFTPAYSFLLGRLWIHVVGAVTSTLYKKLKFMFREKLIIVYGGEDFMISELSSFRYVETEEGIVEVPL